MILWRAVLRYLVRHPLQLFFAVLGVALGVAVVVSIDMANESAGNAFRLSMETLAGRATHQVVGGPRGLPEGLYVKLRLEGGIRECAPVVEGYVGVPSRPGFVLQLTGVDPFAEGPFRSYTAGKEAKAELFLLLTQPGTGLLLPETARRLGVEKGESIVVLAAGVTRSLTMGGFLAPREEATRQALETVSVTDISTAQEILGMYGRLSRIDLIVPGGGEGDERLSRIRKHLPPGAEILRSSARSGAMEQMTRAFRLNLTALSLLALVVGVFLVYNTMTFSVLQRRQILGVLRALGATRRQVFFLVLAEAIGLGVAGTTLGVSMGVALGKALLGMMTRTINDLYFVMAVGEAKLSAFSFGKGIALGVGATLIASLAPAGEAAAAPPRAAMTRSVIETRLRKVVPLAAFAGLAAILAGAGLLFLPGKEPVLAYTALFAVIAGYALVTPAATVMLVRLVRPGAGKVFGTLGKMASRGIVASLSRTGVAIAAMVVAVSATIGVGVMIGSFRLTVVRWLESSLRADLFLTSPGPRTDMGKPPLSPELIRRVSEFPWVASVTTARRALIESGAGATELFVVEIPRSAFSAFPLRQGDEDAAWKRFREGGAVIVSEPYAYHHGLHAGSSIRLRTDKGERDFPVAAVYSDYGSDRGRVAVHLATYERFWEDRVVDSLGIYLVPGTDPVRAAETVREETGRIQPVVVFTNRTLREASLSIFDHTFAITGVLRLLAILVAFVGILNALMAMQIERSRELSAMRALGLTPRQVWRLVCGESGLIGLFAGFLSLPLGVAQALVLIRVINRRSFGWTLQTFIDPWILAQAVLLAVGAALLAGMYPAFRMARSNPAEALREE